MRLSPQTVTSLAMALCVPATSASVLIFSIDGLGDHGKMPAAYGDRIQAADEGTFHYLLDDGPTPNITVDYLAAAPAHWRNGYGDLTNIYFDDEDGAGRVGITLTADAGFLVSLSSFDAAAYDGVFGADPTVNAVTITADCEEVFRLDNTLISEKGRTTFDFSAEPIMGRRITVMIECSNLGSLSDDIGMDNVAFSQVIDEGGSCYPDFNDDGVLDLFDFLAFVNDFNSGGAASDCDLSCGRDLFDFLCFTNAFNAGC